MTTTDNDSRAAPAARRQFLVATIAVLLVYAICELLALLGLYVIEATGRAGYAPTLTRSVSSQHRQILGQLVAGRTGYLRHDAVLGWTNAPDGSNALYAANARGLRADREYAPTPPAGKTRIAAFGDSFMHADDVGNDAAWSAVVESTAPDIEVLNFGVGGYGPDQAYLRYLEEGAEFSPHIVFIGLMSENINRIVNVYRPFYAPDTGNPLAKPYFRLADGRLVAEANPLPSLAAYEDLLERPGDVLPALGKNDFHYAFRYRRGPLDFSPIVRLVKVLLFEVKTRVASPFLESGQYRTDAAPYRLLDRLLGEFRCAALANDSLPVTVLFPHRADIVAAIDGEPVTYRPLVDALRREGHPVIDLAGAFASLPDDARLDDYVLAHYTERGNALVAAFVVDAIRDNGYDEAGARRQSIQGQRPHCSEARNGATDEQA